MDPASLEVSHPTAVVSATPSVAAATDDAATTEKKLVKRTAALHVGYVGTGYKGV